MKKINLLIRLIMAAQKVDQSRISEVTEITTKAINAILGPSVGDRAETDNYKNYVSSIMTINERLMPVFVHLVKRNKNEALDFAAHINVREIRLMLNYTFLIDSLRVDAEARQ